MIKTGVDDPLFRAIDADDFRVNGASARDFTNLTQNGLVRVTIPLPANVKLLDCGASVPCPASALPTGETVADVWRSVPSILDVKITGPDGAGPAWPRGPNLRWRLPARRSHRHAAEPGAGGASQAMPGVTVDPPSRFLDDLAAFQNTQFSSPSVRALSDAIAKGTSPLPDPDPVLDALETAGKVSVQPGVRASATATWAAIRAAALRSCRARRARRRRSCVTTPSRRRVQGRSTTLLRRASRSRHAARAR